MSIRIPTPEFLLWSLRLPCPIRSELSAQHGEPVWRHLRPLQEFSLAQEQNRILEGICVELSADQIDLSDPGHKGFRVDELLAYFGGLDFVSQQCSGCPANTAKSLFERALAGCAGLLPSDATNPPLPDLFQTSIEEIGLSRQILEAFPPTTPRWYGLWCDSPISSSQLELLEQIVQHLIDTEAAESQSSRELLLFFKAIRISRTANLPLDVELFPSGNHQEKNWIVASHCPRCKAAMAPTERHCQVCGRTGHCNPARKRRSRGDRPYWPLNRFLGETGAIQFLARYRDSHQLRRAAANNLPSLREGRTQ